jgi:hypothetical protein
MMTVPHVVTAAPALTPLHLPSRLLLLLHLPRLLLLLLLVLVVLADTNPASLQCIVLPSTYPP